MNTEVSKKSSSSQVMDSGKLISNLSDAIGQLDDLVIWPSWRAKFIRCCKLFDINCLSKECFGLVNVVLERVVVRGSSVASLLDSQMLRESDDISLLVLLDSYFKLVNNPLLKIKRIKTLEYVISGMNLLDYARLVFTLCEEVGIVDEKDQVLWVLAGVGDDVMSKLPQDVLNIVKRESLISLLASVINKFNIGNDNVNISAIYAKQEVVKKCKNCKSTLPDNKFNYCNKCYEEWKSTKFKEKKKEKKESKSNLSSIGMSQSISFSQSQSYLSSSVFIFEKELTIMWDTGASKSFGIPSIQYKDFVKSDSLVTYANGSKELSKEKGLVELNIGDRVLSFWVQIVKSLPAPIIVGMDVLKDKVHLDLINNRILFKDGLEVMVNNLSSYDVTEYDYPCLIGLTGKLRETIVKWIIKFRSLESSWSVTPPDIDIFDVKLKDEIPVFQNPTKFYGNDLGVVQDTVKKWFDSGIIRRSKSKYASRMLLVNRKLPDGSIKYRLVPHYVEINEKILSENYPLPIPRDCASRITGRFKSIIDINSAYLHCRSTKLSSEVLAFTVEHIKGYGSHFEFCEVMPWSPKNAGRHLQRLVENIGKFDYSVNGKIFNRNLLHEYMEVFQDDISLHNDDLD